MPESNEERGLHVYEDKVIQVAAQVTEIKAQLGYMVIEQRDLKEGQKRHDELIKLLSEQSIKQTVIAETVVKGLDQHNKELEDIKVSQVETDKQTATNTNDIAGLKRGGGIVLGAFVSVLVGLAGVVLSHFIK